MKTRQFNYIFDRIKNVAVPNNDEVQSENIIDGLVESREYQPVKVEGLTFEVDSDDGSYVLTFDYDEVSDINNALISIDFNGDKLDLTILQYCKLEDKLFNNIKFV